MRPILHRATKKRGKGHRLNKLQAVTVQMNIIERRERGQVRVQRSSPVRITTKDTTPGAIPIVTITITITTTIMIIITIVIIVIITGIERRDRLYEVCCLRLY
jgi:hypothetical protein